MKYVIKTNIEEFYLYGCRVIYDKAAGLYKTWFGGNCVSATSRSDIAYKIMSAQSHPTI